MTDNVNAKQLYEEYARFKKELKPEFEEYSLVMFIQSLRSIPTNQVMHKLFENESKCEISKETILSLQKATGVGLKRCKQVLIENNGMFEESVKAIKNYGNA